MVMWRRGWWSGCGRAAASTLPRSREVSLRGETVEGRREGRFVKIVMSYYLLQGRGQRFRDDQTTEIRLQHACKVGAQPMLPLPNPQRRNNGGWKNTLLPSSLTMISNYVICLPLQRLRGGVRAYSRDGSEKLKSIEGELGLQQDLGRSANPPQPTSYLQGTQQGPSLLVGLYTMTSSSLIKFPTT